MESGRTRMGGPSKCDRPAWSDGVLPVGFFVPLPIKVLFGRF